MTLVSIKLNLHLQHKPYDFEIYCDLKFEYVSEATKVIIAKHRETLKQGILTAGEGQIQLTSLN